MDKFDRQDLYIQAMIKHIAMLEKAMRNHGIAVPDVTFENHLSNVMDENLFIRSVDEVSTDGVSVTIPCHG